MGSDRIATMGQPRPAARIPFLALLILSLAVPAFAEGRVGGRLTTPEGAPAAGVKIALVPAGKVSKGGRLPGKTGKDGKYFYGIVSNGEYVLSIEDPGLVMYSIKLVVYDTEQRKNIVDYDGPAPTTGPQIFEASSILNVTYDAVVGDPEKSPAALARKAAEAQAGALEVPALLQAGDYQTALARIDKALSAVPDDAQLHYLRGYALFRNKEYDGAQAALARALEINPSQAGAHFIMGGVISAKGQKTEAIEEFTKELANPAADPATRLNCHINIGLLKRELGDKEGAIAAFKTVIELDSSQAEAYSYLAELYLVTGQAELAAETEARAKSAGAQDPGALFNIGASYWNNKDFAKAESYFRQAVEADPKFAVAWKQLGYAAVNLGNIEQAKEALAKYLELAPQAEDAKEVKDLLEAIRKP